MDIRYSLVQVKNAAGDAAGFIKRHKRACIAAAAALIILGPLLTGSGVGAAFLNLVGLGIVALIARRIMRAKNRHRAAQARQANRRCHRQQQTANQQPRGGSR